MLVCSKGKLMGLTEQHNVQLCFLTTIPHQTGLQFPICLGKDNEETVSRKQRACYQSKISPCCSPDISLQATQSAEHKTTFYCSRCIQILQRQQKNTQLVTRQQNHLDFLFGLEINFLLNSLPDVQEESRFLHRAVCPIKVQWVDLCQKIGKAIQIQIPGVCFGDR